MSRLKITVETEPSALTVRLGGSLTGEAREQLEALAKSCAAAKRASLHWDQVILANSDGLRVWIDFQNLLPPERVVELHGLRPPVVTVFNIVKSSVKRARIVTLYASFSCLACAREFETLLSVGADVARD